MEKSNLKHNDIQGLHRPPMSKMATKRLLITVKAAMSIALQLRNAGIPVKV